MTNRRTPPARIDGARLGALLWIAQPLAILVELVTVGQVRTPYSLVDSTISEAGAVTCTKIAYGDGHLPVCSPLGWLLSATTAASGLAVLIGALLVHRALPSGRIRLAATVTGILSGLSLVGTGLVPVDLYLDLHVLVALPQFLTFPLQLVLLAVVLRPLTRPTALISALAAALCLAGTVAFFARLSEPHGGGLLERLALWPYFLALLPLGVAVRRRSR